MASSLGLGAVDECEEEARSLSVEVRGRTFVGK
jgi:hypothetical protein